MKKVTSTALGLFCWKQLLAGILLIMAVLLMKYQLLLSLKNVYQNIKNLNVLLSDFAG